PTARTRAFAADADGTIWAEGAGLLLLERLADARRNGHRVLALIRGSAVNQDGTSNGLSAPNGLAQQRVVRQALADAGLSGQDVDVVEAHGTGTPLGDPIEANALLATYGQDHPPEQPLRLGSLKSTIGHTQAAAGAASTVKMIMAMRHGVLPKTLHVTAPSDKVDWSTGAVRVLAEAAEWPRLGRPRRAAGSSFGISGTNAHLILEDPPAATSPDASPADAVPATAPSGPAGPRGAAHREAGGSGLPATLWPVSAKSGSALRAQAERLLAAAAELEPGGGGGGPADLGWSLAPTRGAFRHRAVVLGADRHELTRGLRQLADGAPDPKVVQDVAAGGPLAVLFTGQGAEREGMGRALYAAFPAYARAYDEVRAHLEFPALPLDQTGHAQRALV